MLLRLLTVLKYPLNKIKVRHRVIDWDLSAGKLFPECSFGQEPYLMLLF